MQHLTPTLTIAALVTAIGILGAPAANASLIGDTLTLDSYASSGVLLDSATGVAGTDDLTVVQYFGDDFFVPVFTAHTVAFEFDTTFAGSTHYRDARLVLSGLDWNGSGVLADAALLSSDNAGITGSDLSIFGDALVISIAGTWFDGQAFEIGIRGKHHEAPLPEPSAAVVFGIGLVIIRRRTRRVQAR